MNKPLIENRFRKGLATYDQQADAQLLAARNVADMLGAHFTKGCGTVLEIGCGTGLLTEQILRQTPVREMYLNDMVWESEEIVKNKIDRHHHPIFKFLHGDAERIPFPDSLDAVVSASAMQWFTDLPGFFHKAQQALRPGGWLCASTFGPGNLSEIKQLTGIGLQYPETETLRNWLRADFQCISITEHKINMPFDTPREVLRHLKNTGVNGVVTPAWTPGTLRSFEARYNDLFLSDNKVTLSYHIVLIQAQKAPAASFTRVPSSGRSCSEHPPTSPPALPFFGETFQFLQSPDNLVT